MTLNHITAKTRDDEKARYSSELSPGQPVILPGGTLAFATGYEQHGKFEVRIGSIYSGDVILISSLIPSSEDTQRRDLATVHLGQLDVDLDRLFKAAEHTDTKEMFLRMRTELSHIETGIRTGTYGDLTAEL